MQREPDPGQTLGVVTRLPRPAYNTSSGAMLELKLSFLDGFRVENVWYKDTLTSDGTSRGLLEVANNQINGLCIILLE